MISFPSNSVYTDSLPVKSLFGSSPPKNRLNPLRATRSPSSVNRWSKGPPGTCWFLSISSSLLCPGLTKRAPTFKALFRKVCEKMDDDNLVNASAYVPNTCHRYVMHSQGTGAVLYTIKHNCDIKHYAI